MQNLKLVAIAIKALDALFAMNRDCGREEGDIMEARSCFPEWLSDSEFCSESDETAVADLMKDLSDQGVYPDGCTHLAVKNGNKIAIYGMISGQMTKTADFNIEIIEDNRELAITAVCKLYPDIHWL